MPEGPVIPREGLEVVTSLAPPGLTITLRGELDVATLRALNNVHPAHLPDGDEVLIDLRELHFCDVAGMRALTRLRAQQERAGHSVMVVGACPLVQRVAQLFAKPSSGAAWSCRAAGSRPCDS